MLFVCVCVCVVCVCVLFGLLDRGSTITTQTQRTEQEKAKDSNMAQQTLCKVDNRTEHSTTTRKGTCHLRLTMYCAGHIVYSCRRYAAMTPWGWVHDKKRLSKKFFTFHQTFSLTKDFLKSPSFFSLKSFHKITKLTLHSTLYTLHYIQYSPPRIVQNRSTAHTLMI